MKKLLNILTSFSLAIFIICGSIIVGLKCKSLYYYDVKKLNISDVSGFSDDEIKLNYDYKDLSFIPLKPSLHQQTALAWKKEQFFSPATTAFIKYAKEYFKR